MKPFNNPMAQKAINLYHKRMHAAHLAKTVHMDKDPVVQFVLAGYEIERRELVAQLGIKVK